MSDRDAFRAEQQESETDECTCPPGRYMLGCEVHGWVVASALAHECGVACHGE